MHRIYVALAAEAAGQAFRYSGTLFCLPFLKAAQTTKADKLPPSIIRATLAV